MSLETDLLIDRRRLKRRLFFWRALTVLAVIAAVLSAVRPSGFSGGSLGGKHVARLTVNGVISEDDALTRKVRALADDSSVAALEVVINSPGGTVAGGESLHDAIAYVAAKKPVVAVMRGIAASAGYMIAVPAVRIWAQGATLTGSIGVLLETGEISGLLAKLGITANTIASGPLKGQPSLTEPMTPEARTALGTLISDMFDQFVDMVARGRHMDVARVRELADGRAYTGRQALKLGLIDAIGSEPDARAWLARNDHVSADLPAVDIVQRGFLAREFGESLFGGLLGFLKIQSSQGLRLDGAWALWQPAG